MMINRMQIGKSIKGENATGTESVRISQNQSSLNNSFDQIACRRPKRSTITAKAKKAPNFFFFFFLED